MTRMKLMVAAAAALAALAGTQGAFAQTGSGMGSGMGPGDGKMRKHGKMVIPDADERLKRMDAKLGLSDEQKAKIRPIIEDEIAQLKALQEDTSLTRTQKRERLQEIRTRCHSRIREHLTAEQQKQVDAMKQKGTERREVRKDRMQERMKERMKETPTQP